MKRIEEARKLLEGSAEKAIGLPAIGHAIVDARRVMIDYTELFQNQLTDGSLPSIGESKWNEHLLHGYLLGLIYQDIQKDQALITSLRELYPRLLGLQQYYYRSHDLLENGLIVLDGVIDPQINGLFAASNESLIEIGYELDMTSDDLFEKNELTLHSMNNILWDDGAGLYYHYDLSSKSVLKNRKVSGFIPLVAGAPDIDQVLTMVHRAFGDDFRKDDHYSIPSLSLNLPTTDPQSAKQVSIKISTNWLLVQGLRRYDMDDLADVVLEDTVTLIEQFGFYAYFDSLKYVKENGYGANQCTSTAACFIDLLREDF